MVKLNIYFFKWDNFYGRVIRKVTGDEWSHIGIGFTKKDKHIVYEALNKGFVKNEYGKHLDTNKYCKIIEINTNYSITYIIRELDKLLGKGYDWISIFNIFTMSIFKKKFINLKGNRLLICSEAVARALNNLKIIDLSKELEKEFDYITPQDIYNFYRD